MANTGLTGTGVPLAAEANTLRLAQCKQVFREFEKPKTGMGFRRAFPGKRIARNGYVVKRVLEKILLVGTEGSDGGNLAEMRRGSAAPLQRKKQISLSEMKRSHPQK